MHLLSTEYEENYVYGSGYISLIALVPASRAAGTHLCNLSSARVAGANCTTVVFYDNATLLIKSVQTYQ